MIIKKYKSGRLSGRFFDMDNPESCCRPSSIAVKALSPAIVDYHFIIDCGTFLSGSEGRVWRWQYEFALGLGRGVSVFYYFSLSIQRTAYWQRGRIAVKYRFNGTGRERTGTFVEPFERLNLSKEEKVCVGHYYPRLS